jgi:hypothetical protein
MTELNTPVAQGDRGVEKLGGTFHVPNTPTVYQVQHLIARHAMTLESAAIIAALAFGGSHNG